MPVFLKNQMQFLRFVCFLLILLQASNIKVFFRVRQELGKKSAAQLWLHFVAELLRSKCTPFKSLHLSGTSFPQLPGGCHQSNFASCFALGATKRVS